MGLGNRYQPTNAPGLPGVLAGLLPGPVVPGGESQPVVGMQFDPYYDAEDGVADASGVVTLTFGPAPFLWLVDRIVVQNDGALASVAKVYVGTVAAKNLRDGTGNGNLDVADEVSPIRVPPGALLTIRWTGCTVGSTSTGTVDYWQQRP